MAVVIRRIEIQWFRGIESFTWCPSAGLNCLLGPGDSGKSSVLDAIDLCLGARRTAQFLDSDFHQLDTSRPITIVVTLGQLSDSLRSIDTYGLFLRGFDPATGQITDEPAKGLETVLTVSLVVGADLEPIWSLVSDRATSQGVTRGLAWKDRSEIAPLRIGAHSAHNFSWQRGSIVTRVADERIGVSGALMKAARTARSAFGDTAEPQLQSTLQAVSSTATTLGIDLGARPRALLDAHAASFTAGGIALHTETGVPLRNLGTGSSRLLIAGLQQLASQKVPIVLVDEVEHGLEPHRLVRFLHALGAKTSPPQAQCFLTTHSPVAVRELSSEQLVILRNFGEFGIHAKSPAGLGADGAIRLFPEALLARSVIVCEGASEVGFIRGLDLFRDSLGHASLCARGATLVDGGGGVTQIYGRAVGFRLLDYPVLLFRDNDVPVPPAIEQPFVETGGTVATWRPGNCLEVEIFISAPTQTCLSLVNYAFELHGHLIREHVQTVSNNGLTLEAVWREAEQSGGLSEGTRRLLGQAASLRKAGWFKQIATMEHVARNLVGPALPQCQPEFVAGVARIFDWIEAHGR